MSDKLEFVECQILFTYEKWTISNTFAVKNIFEVIDLWCRRTLYGDWKTNKKI